MTEKSSRKPNTPPHPQSPAPASGMHPAVYKILSENRLFLVELIENSGTLIVIKDREGRYLLVNRKWEEVTGLDRESVLGRTDAMLFAPEMARQFRSNDLRVIEAGAVIEAEERLETPIETRYFLSSKFPLFGDDGSVAGLYGVITEITELKRTQKALLESREKFESLFHSAQVALFRTSVDGKLLEINQRYAEKAGYASVAECMAEFQPGKAWADPGERDRMVALLRQKGSVSDFEAEIIRRDGSHIWILFSAILYPEEDYIEGSIVDITDRKQAELALRDSEARFKALHNASFGGIAIHDKGLILECNQGLCEMTGYSMEELIGMDGLRLIAEKSRPAVMHNILSGYEKPYEAVALHKDGTEFPIRLEARNVPYLGKMVRTTEFRDISESKRAEEERARLQAQLTQAQKMESVGRLAGGVAHDYNNMLGVILGYAELALGKVSRDDPIHANLRGIFKAAKRSAEITQQLLAFARKQTISPRALDINVVIERMLKMLRRLIGEDINIAWNPGDGLPPVKIDPSQLEQTLANLCVNARDAIAGAGSIVIETRLVTLDQDDSHGHPHQLRGEFVLLSVSDDGCGMDRDTLENIFEPFFTTKEVSQGTGLGLAMVYGIVKQNNGVIDVHSKPGGGTTFNIYLPRHSGDTDELLADGRPVTPMGKGETVLLVEDEPAISEMCQAILKETGYRVLSAGSPEEALRLAGEHAGGIDLLLTDVVMPGMNGRELAKRLKSRFPDMRALYMSGYTADVIANQGVLEKEVRFIQKPFSVRNLAIKVREALQGS